MNLIPGKINTIKDRTIIYESGDNIETICFIKKGSVIKDDSKTGTTSVSAGCFIGHLDIYNGFYSAQYTAEPDTELIPILADSPSTLVHFLSANPSVHAAVAPAICQMIVDFHQVYNSLFYDVDDFYASVDSSYERYIECCRELSKKPEEFLMPHDVRLYRFEEQDFAKNYNIIASIASVPGKAEAVFKANGIKFLKVQTALINSIFTTYDDMVFYLRSMVSLYTGKDDKCLFALASKLEKSSGNHMQVTALLKDMKSAITNFDMAIQQHTGIALDIDYNRVDFFFMTSHKQDDNEDDDMYANALDDDDDFDLEYSPYNDSESNQDDISYAEEDNYYEEDIPDFSNTLKQLCDFAEMSYRYEEFNGYVEKFMTLADKESREDSVRVFRKMFTSAFYELYEEVFIHYARNGEHNSLVELFLNYGFLDERLLTDAQIEFLCSIPPLNRTEPCKVYRMKDWLMRVYNGEEIPSKNEFDMEYIDYVRDRKKNEALSSEAEHELLTNNETKVRFEIQNMLKYNCRLINGGLLSFFPMLHMENFEGEMDNLLLTSETINEQISKLLEIDYSVFYREMLYAAPEKKIEKEAIQKEIFPNIILFPVSGVNGIMWQEISGKRSNSEGRIFLPAFFNGKLEDTFLTLFGRYHWELCKTLQGTAWNNIAVPSLTSEYSDYIQFYRKNKDLSAEKKEALKNQFTRCRNNMREIFVYDYIIWMKFESAGAIRLNKVARRILATYCPFSKDIRSRIANQPIFEEAMAKFVRDRQKKCKEFMLRMKALEKKEAEITKELTDTQHFYNDL